jgi:hypothetical protein
MHDSTQKPKLCWKEINSSKVGIFMAVRDSDTLEAITLANAKSNDSYR